MWPKNIETELHCNFCGRQLGIFDIQEPLLIKNHMGYGSKFDGEVIDIRFCCDCFDAIVEQCEISPVKEGNSSDH